MRIAALSDIHGNLAALEAVIADIAAWSPDVVVNLGDHLSGPLEAGEVADLLAARTDWVQIRGNHDRRLLEAPPDVTRSSDRAAYRQLNERRSAWLRSLAPAAAISDDIHLCHGMPSNDSEYLLEDVSSGIAGIARGPEIRSRLGDLTGLILCGHSHVPRLVRLEDGTTILNPGSVGLQAYDDPEYRFPHVIENGSPHARYALIERVDGAWRATFRAVEYDWTAAAKTARKRGRPDWAYHLLTGYALRLNAPRVR
jgi:putative phosphoesterase